MDKKEEAKKSIAKLIERYNQLSEQEISEFNEERTKQVFIRPLFEALGWDFEKEVLPEEKVSNGRVDYAFVSNGITKFFLEAKKLSTDLDETRWVEQVTNYGWHKNVTWAVLCDFEGIKIFNCEVKEENPLKSQFLGLHYNQYIDRFEKLWLLSKESFGHNLLDKEAEEYCKKLKKVPVDKQLLNDLTKFRELLSKDILKNNKDLTEDQLDEVVQRIIDRFIFIRTCEDRHLVDQILLPLVRENKNKKIITKLKEAFRSFDDWYDSNLFSNHLADQVEISDDVLEIVISGLFRTKDGSVSYDFGIIDADVLGNIYEQYLGYLLKKTEKRAKLSEGKVHRKEQGIYYTPTYIVKYIVENTIGELAKNKKFDLDDIKVLDPACGSGSFLIKAFDYLVNLKSKKEDINQTKLETSDLTVTFSKKLDILKNNIFGVDLDERAVEIAQLNLLIKLAEKKQRLPMLQENIKCGNSLIDDSNIVGDKAFEWEEKFKEIIKEGGFDTVIGNPPWVESKKFEKKEKEFYEKHFKVAKKQYDLFSLFVERSLQNLKEGGILGFIVPDRFITNLDYENFREFLLNSCKILKIVHLGDNVFPEVNMPSAIIILQKESSKTDRDSNKVNFALCSNKSLTNISYEKKGQKEFLKSKGFVFSIFSTNEVERILKKIEKDSLRFEEIVDNARGVEIGKKSNLVSDKKIGKDYVKFLIGSDIDRYSILSTHYLLLNQNEVDYKRPELYQSKKILIRKTGEGIKATLDAEEHYVIQVIYIFKTKKDGFDEHYLLAILNSRLIQFYYFSVFGEKDRKTFPHLTQGKVLQLPIRVCSKTRQKPIIELVDKILSLNKRLNEIGDKKTDETTRIKMDIEKTNREIDNAIYDIYGISDKEKEIIESN